MADKSGTAAGKILHNSLWFGLETVFETIVFLGSSIAVARHYTVVELGYFQFINFFVTTITRTSGSGLATATRRYMSEFLALDRPGAARAVYNFTFRYQLISSVAISSLMIVGIWLFSDPHYKLMASIMVYSLVPGVMSWVPAQANQAFEDVSNNTLSAFAYMISYGLIIAATLHFEWGLVGVASALAISRTLETVLRIFPLHRRLRKIPLAELPRDYIRRIRRFCLQAIGLQLLTSVVWDRSELLFLRAFSSLEQISFYSVSFSLAANLLLIPRTFGGAAGITLMVESLRDPKRVDNLVRTASRFLLLVVLPVHLGAMAITGEAIRFVYTSKYVGAIPVLLVAALLAIPRGFQEIPETLMRAADRQKQLIKWMIITGVINLALDALLIPRYAAVGAAWANGLAQTFGILAIWRLARQEYVFRFPFASASRLCLAALAMAGVAHAIVIFFPGRVGLAAAILVAAPIYILGVRVFRGLDPGDYSRLSALANRMPEAARPAVLASLRFAINVKA